MDVDKIAFVTDLSGRETHAYRIAAILAGKLGALLQLVHVVEQGGRCLRWAEERLIEAADGEAAFRGVRVQTVTLGGSDPYGLLADFTERENAQLIVCAHSTVETDGFSGERILPERLADVCAAPLLVLARDDELAGKRGDPGPRRVLIPYDLYEATHASVDVRGFLSREYQPVSFYVYRRPEVASYDPYGEHDVESLPSASEAEADTVHVLLGSGPPGREMVKSARALKVDLIVVCPSIDGTRPGLSSENVSWILRHAPCSVLAVKVPIGHSSTAPVGEGYEFYCG